MVPFCDLRLLAQRYREEYEAGVRRVLERGWFILGPEVEAFEAEFAAFHGTHFRAVAVANGTDAIELALRAGGIGAGDEVITTPLTAVPTVCAIERAGARAVLADIDADTLTLDPRAVRAALTPRTRAIVPVHLYGQPADMDALLELARSEGLLVVEDCAQAHGARIDGQLVGTFGALAAFSCYPTKNLGAFGDAGVVLTRDAALADRLRRLRNYGQATRNDHVERGCNSRLDEMQAALLRTTLRHLGLHNEARQQLAARYRDQLTHVRLQPHDERLVHAYHLFVVRHTERDRLQQRLAAHRIETAIHYPKPIHLQPAYSDLGHKQGSLPVSELACRQILSLPLFLGMTFDQVDTVCDAFDCSLREAA